MRSRQGWGLVAMYASLLVATALSIAALRAGLPVSGGLAAAGAVMFALAIAGRRRQNAARRQLEARVQDRLERIGVEKGSRL